MDCKQGAEEIREQVIEVLDKIPAAEYIRPRAVFNGASLGQHFRHIIEFYQCLLLGVSSGWVDYAARRRDHRLETDIAFARDTFQHLRSSLSGLDESQPIEVLADFSNRERPTVRSTVGRELMFAYDHAIHHLAIIRIGLEGQLPGLPVRESFGMAPSTIKHRKANR